MWFLFRSTLGRVKNSHWFKRASDPAHTAPATNQKPPPFSTHNGGVERAKFESCPEIKPTQRKTGLCRMSP